MRRSIIQPGNRSGFFSVMGKSNAKRKAIISPTKICPKHCMATGF